jgi:hypothetical protein
MYSLLNDLESLTVDLKANKCGDQLVKDHKWLRHVNVLITSNCSIMPPNLKYLRYTGLIFAGYNTLLMHVLLSGTLPVSAMACIPIITSLLANYIGPTHIVLLGLFEFAQVLLSIFIMGTFVFLKEKRSQQLATLRDSNKNV